MFHIETFYSFGQTTALAFPDIDANDAAPAGGAFRLGVDHGGSA